MTDTGSKVQAFAHSALRVVAGFLFTLHGVQKVFGALGRDRVESFATLIGVAGVLELVGGVLLVVGLFTRPVAFLLSGQMVVAYFIAHAPQGFWPIMNNGELALLYAFVWFYFFAAGAGKLSLDGLVKARKGGSDEYAAMG